MPEMADIRHQFRLAVWIYRRWVTLFLGAAVLCNVLVWIASHRMGYYVVVSRTMYLSIARGYCRIVAAPPHADWSGKLFVRLPLSQVGDYAMGSNALYVHLVIPLIAI